MVLVACSTYRLSSQLRIEYPEIAKRDVGGYDIESCMLKTLFSNGFKCSRPC